RCTSLEGLVLTSPINRQFLGAHESLIDWQQKNYNENSLPQRFAESRGNYISQEIQSIFTWKEWYYRLKDLQKLIEELKDELPSECTAWVKNLMNQQTTLYE